MLSGFGSAGYLDGLATVGNINAPWGMFVLNDKMWFADSNPTHKLGITITEFDYFNFLLDEYLILGINSGWIIH